MTITAKVIEDSTSYGGVRLTTLQLKYPRMIHSEFMTHRVFSRNASSSRAIPVRKIIQEVLDDPAMPVVWGKNEPGMQAHTNFEGDEARDIEELWLIARDDAVRTAKALVARNAHKQIVNRILEPFAHISVIVTATEWDNFFALRDHEAADPTIQVLARAMKEAMEGSAPVLRHCNDYIEDAWHLPYISAEERDTLWNEPKLLAKASAGRCARVSYLNHDGTAPDITKDVALYELLAGSEPRHASPVEHQATPIHSGVPIQWNRNFRGWIQFRDLVESERV